MNGYMEYSHGDSQHGAKAQNNGAAATPKAVMTDRIAITQFVSVHHLNVLSPHVCDM